MSQRMPTAELLVKLGVPKDFIDPGLPRGTMSHSQYNSYLICGQAYYYKYVEGRTTPGYAATSRGSAVHSGIEFALIAKMNKQKIPSLAEAMAIVSDSFDNEAKSVLSWGEESEGSIKDNALGLYKLFHEKNLPNLNPIAVEKGFAAKIGDVPVVGYIDLLDDVSAVSLAGLPAEVAAIAPRKIVVVDSKTSSKKWSESQVRSNGQLTLYAGVENTPFVRIDQLVQPASGKVSLNVVPSERTQQDIALLAEHYNEVAGFIKKGVFPKAPLDSWACSESHCSFWKDCRGKQR